MPLPQKGHSAGDILEGGIEAAIVAATRDSRHATRARHRKKDGFSNKIQIPKFGGKKGHPHDVASAFRHWARCITYYRDYYEDSYLMPLVVLPDG